MGKAIFEHDKQLTGYNIPHYNPKSRYVPPEWNEEVFKPYNNCSMTREILGIAYLILGLQFSLVRGLVPWVNPCDKYHTDNKHSRIIFAMKRRKNVAKKDFVAHFMRTAEFKNTD